MRRAAFAILGTAAAASLLVGIKAQAETQQPVAEQPEAAPPANGPVQPDAKQPGGKGTASSAPPAGGAAAPGGATGPVVRKGDPIQTPFGPVTVTVTLTGTKITKVEATMPESGESAKRTAKAKPALIRQTLEKQSADVDTVSGATYTSEAYKDSLQSALDGT